MGLVVRDANEKERLSTFAPNRLSAAVHGEDWTIEDTRGSAVFWGISGTDVGVVTQYNSGSTQGRTAPGASRVKVPGQYGVSRRDAICSAEPHLG